MFLVAFYITIEGGQQRTKQVMALESGTEILRATCQWGRKKYLGVKMIAIHLSFKKSLLCAGSAF